MPEFIFVRHGESEANAAGKIAPLGSPLTAKGKSQARKTGQKLKHRGINKILCSPLLRARQTAEIIASEIGIEPSKIIYVDELQERLAPGFEGKPREHPGEWYVLTDDSAMEAREVLFLRMKTAYRKIITEIEKGSRVLVVGHGASGYYLLEVAKGSHGLDDLEPLQLILNADILEVKFD